MLGHYMLRTMSFVHFLCGIALQLWQQICQCKPKHAITQTRNNTWHFKWNRNRCYGIMFVFCLASSYSATLYSVVLKTQQMNRSTWLKTFFSALVLYLCNMVTLTIFIFYSQTPHYCISQLDITTQSKKYVQIWDYVWIYDSNSMPKNTSQIQFSGASTCICYSYCSSTNNMHDFAYASTLCF